MSDINIFKIDGKPISKLIEVIRDGIGVLYKPKAIRKEADAEAYKIEVVERAKAKAIAEGKEIEAKAFERIESRIIHKETIRQHNIDQISQIAFDQIGQEETVSDEPVDPDWTSRFFNIAQDINDEEMQRLWGRILAGEVKKPKSYSLRTLDVLRNLTHTEAKVFEKIAKKSFKTVQVTFVLKAKNNDELIKSYGISFGEKLLLEEAGLLLPSFDLNYTFSGLKESSPFIFGKYVIIVKVEEKIPRFKIPVIGFTKAGSELSHLIDQQLDLEYLNQFAEKINKEKIMVSYGKIKRITDSQISVGEEFKLPIKA